MVTGDSHLFWVRITGDKTFLCAFLENIKILTLHVGDCPTILRDGDSHLFLVWQGRLGMLGIVVCMNEKMSEKVHLLGYCIQCDTCGLDTSYYDLIEAVNISKTTLYSFYESNAKTTPGTVMLKANVLDKMQYALYIVKQLFLEVKTIKCRDKVFMQ